MNESDPFISSIWMAKRRQQKPNLDFPDIVKSFMIFDDPINTETNKFNALEKLMQDVDEIEEDSMCDGIKTELCFAKVYY